MDIKELMMYIDKNTKIEIKGEGSNIDSISGNLSITLSNTNNPKGIMSLRIKNGLTRKDLAKQSGIPLRTIQAWEKGTRKPTHYEGIEKLCSILKCTPDEII